MAVPPGPRRRRLVPAACALAALTLVLAGAGVAGAVAAGGSATADRARARSEARRLLGAVRLPAGAVRVPGEPAGDHRALARPGYDVATPNLVDAHAFWTVPGSSAAVLVYVAARLPAGARPTFTEAGNMFPVAIE